MKTVRSAGVSLAGRRRVPYPLAASASVLTILVSGVMSALPTAAVAQTAGKMTLIRSKLTPEEEKLSADEVARNRRPIEPLQPGEVVLTRGVVELTAALEELVANPPKKQP